MGKTIKVLHCNTYVRVTIVLTDMYKYMQYIWGSGFVHEARTWINDNSWTQFAMPLRHFRDKGWVVYERLCCMFHCEKQEVPHARN